MNLTANRTPLCSVQVAERGTEMEATRIHRLQGVEAFGDTPVRGETKEALFARVAEEVAPRLYHTALALLGNAPDAEDAVQEALLKGYRAHAGFRREAEISTWLYRITVNLCHDLGRRRAAGKRLEARLRVYHAEVDADLAPDEQVERCLEGRELASLLRSLDEHHRVPLVLKHVAGRSIREIAVTLKIPEGTVKRRLHEAYLKLREAVRLREAATNRRDRE
ncbi:MAG: RNA polymerase sigma factor [Methanocella sp.]